MESQVAWERDRTLLGSGCYWCCTVNAPPTQFRVIGSGYTMHALVYHLLEGKKKLVSLFTFQMIRFNGGQAWHKKKLQSFIRYRRRRIEITLVWDNLFSRFTAILSLLHLLPAWTKGVLIKSPITRMTLFHEF